MDEKWREIIQLEYERLDEKYGKQWFIWKPAEKRKASSVAGQELLYRMVKEKAGVDLYREKDPIGRLPQGKPYLVKHEDIFFNISHSENMVACVLSKRPVGLDIQFQKEGNWKRAAQRILSPKEWEVYEKNGYDSRCFFEFWTKKESYLKYTGEGIRRELREVEYPGVTFVNLEPEEKYLLTICFENRSYL